LKFADDTKVFGKTADPADHLLLHDDINHLIEWSADWQMLFNVDKCKVMHFGRKNQEYVYYMNGHKLDSVTLTAEKDSVIWISHDLKASQQCIQAYSKANKLLGVTNRTIRCKDVVNLIRSLQVINKTSF